MGLETMLFAQDLPLGISLPELSHSDIELVLVCINLLPKIRENLAFQMVQWKYWHFYTIYRLTLFALQDKPFLYQSLLQ